MNGNLPGFRHWIHARATARTVAAAIVLAAQPALVAQTSPVKGVQAVLLHCWNKDSREAMQAVLATENHFAISSAPYLKEPSESGLFDPCSMAPGQTNRLGNIGRLMSDLSTTPEFHLIVFAGNLHDGSASADLSTHVGQIWSELIAPHAAQTNFTFHLGASLEDNYPNDQVDKIFQEVASGIPAGSAALLQSLVYAKRFSFHRSPNGNGGDSGNHSVDVTVGKTKIYAVPITHERHGASPSSGYQAWSNDGPFVYWNRQNGRVMEKEQCGSGNYCGLLAAAANQAIPLDTFESRAAAGQIQLLWRPAYNLFSWTDQTNGNTTTRVFNKPARVRSDGASSGFDSWEAEVLKEFFK